MADKTDEGKVYKTVVNAVAEKVFGVAGDVVSEKLLAAFGLDEDDDKDKADAAVMAKLQTLEGELTAIDANILALRKDVGKLGAGLDELRGLLIQQQVQTLLEDLEPLAGYIHVQFEHYAEAIEVLARAEAEPIDKILAYRNISAILADAPKLNDAMLGMKRKEWSAEIPVTKTLLESLIASVTQAGQTYCASEANLAITKRSDKTINWTPRDGEDGVAAAELLPLPELWSCHKIVAGSLDAADDVLRHVVAPTLNTLLLLHLKGLILLSLAWSQSENYQFRNDYKDRSNDLSDLLEAMRQTLLGYLSSGIKEDVSYNFTQWGQKAQFDGNIVFGQYARESGDPVDVATSDGSANAVWGAGWKPMANPFKDDWIMLGLVNMDSSAYDADGVLQFLEEETGLQQWGDPTIPNRFTSDWGHPEIVMIELPWKLGRRPLQFLSYAPKSTVAQGAPANAVLFNGEHLSNLIDYDQTKHADYKSGQEYFDIDPSLMSLTSADEFKGIFTAEDRSKVITEPARAALYAVAWGISRLNYTWNAITGNREELIARTPEYFRGLFPENQGVPPTSLANWVSRLMEHYDSRFSTPGESDDLNILPGFAKMIGSKWEEWEGVKAIAPPSLLTILNRCQSQIEKVHSYSPNGIAFEKVSNALFDLLTSLDDEIDSGRLDRNDPALWKVRDSSRWLFDQVEIAEENRADN